VEQTVLWPADGIVPEFWQYRISSESPTQAAPAPAAKRSFPADWHSQTLSLGMRRFSEEWCAVQFEPADTPPISNGLRGECHKCCHTAENSDEELAEVVRGWPRLAGPLRAAVLAIVRSQNGATEGEQP